MLLRAKPTDKPDDRLPGEEGDGQWGCFYWYADQLAAVTDSTGELYAPMLALFARLDPVVAGLLKRDALVQNQGRFQSAVLAELRLISGDLFDATLRELRKCGDEDDFAKDPSPNEIRDWNCWLYRKFKAWKFENELHKQ